MPYNFKEPKEVTPYKNLFLKARTKCYDKEHMHMKKNKLRMLEIRKKCTLTKQKCAKD